MAKTFDLKDDSVVVVVGSGAGGGTLSNELVQRGWMTPFQTREVYRGRGKDLTVGPYVLLDLIGEGGMGRVYKARHMVSMT